MNGSILRGIDDLLRDAVHKITERTATFRRVWVEDSTTRETDVHVTIDTMYKHVYGEELDVSKAVSKHARSDSIDYFMSNGSMVRIANDCDSLWAKE